MNETNKTARRAAVCVALLGLAAAPAHADAGWYIGVGGGVSSLDGFDSGLAADLSAALREEGLLVTIGRFDTDDSDTGLRLFGGFRFNDYVALEAFYTDLGSFDADFAGSVDPGDGPVPFSGQLSVEVQGFGLYGVLTYPLWDEFSLMGKAGGIHWESDLPASVSIDGSVISGKIGDDGTDFAWAGGLIYEVTENLAIDLQYERFTTIEDVDLVSGNLIWSF